jgi:FG-GAP repeat
MDQTSNPVSRTSAIVNLVLTGLTGNNPAVVILADFNGDGRLDFAIANSGSNTAIPSRSFEAGRTEHLLQNLSSHDDGKRFQSRRKSL